MDQDPSSTIRPEKKGTRAFPAPLSGLLVALLLASAQLASGWFVGPLTGAIGQLGDLKPDFSSVGPMALKTIYQTGAAAGVLFGQQSGVVLEEDTKSEAAFQGMIDETVLQLGVRTKDAAEKNSSALQTLGTRAVSRTVALQDSTRRGVSSVVEGTQTGVRATVAAVVAGTESQVVEPTESWWFHVRASFYALSERLANVWLSIAQTLRDYRNIIASNWRQFLHGEEPAEVLKTALPARSTRNLSLEDAKDQIRQEVEEAIRKDLEQALRTIGTAGAGSARPGSLLTVFPSSGSSTVDTTIKNQVKDSFSDEVSVRFDETGQSGVITPIFRRGSGSDYLFILTPLRR